VHETNLKSALWQAFGYIFDGDKKLKDVAGCFMCKNCVPTHAPNYEFHTSSSINVKLAKRKSPVSSQLKQWLKNQKFLQICSNLRQIS
jgi:hypothetical protein